MTTLPLVQFGVLVVAFATGLGAQSPPARVTAADTSVVALTIPSALSAAHYLLGLTEQLHLTDAQALRLTTMEQTQVAAISRATAAFYRAQADLLDASRSDDLAARRSALERRAKVAIDAEIGRLQAEKDSRAVLTTDQRVTLMRLSPSATSNPAIEMNEWRDIVSVPALTKYVRQPDVPDSVEVRIAVSPAYASIYVDNIKVGAGRKFLMVPVGPHELTVNAPGCTEIHLPFAVAKGSAIILPTQILNCAR